MAAYGPGVVNWQGNFVTLGLPCCFEALLKATVAEEARHFSQGYEIDPFGGSPLSSAPSSANPSPPSSPLLLPIESGDEVIESSSGSGLQDMGAQTAIILR